MKNPLFFSSGTRRAIWPLFLFSSLESLNDSIYLFWSSEMEFVFINSIFGSGSVDVFFPFFDDSYYAYLDDPDFQGFIIAE